MAQLPLKVSSQVNKNTFALVVVRIYIYNHNVQKTLSTYGFIDIKLDTWVGLKICLHVYLSMYVLFVFVFAVN